MAVPNNSIGILFPCEMLLTIFATSTFGTTATAQEVTRPPTETTDIVVTGRRSRSSPDAIDRYSTESISTFGVTIGDVIARLERRNGGRPFSIIINGRRLTDISDLREVPLEALEGVEILPSTSAGKYGFQATDNILNLVLKERFASVSAEEGVRLPTEGAGKSANAALRYVNIEQERRFNASATWQGTETLTVRDRGRLIESGSDDAELMPYRTLLPSSRLLGLTAGLAVPVSSISLTISTSLNDGVSHQLSRFFQADNMATQRTSARAVIDTSHTRSYQIGMSASGVVVRLNWSAELSGSVTKSRTSSEPSRLSVRLSQATGASTIPERYVPLAVSSNSSTLGGALAVSSPLVPMPAGDLAVNVRISAETQRLSSRGNADLAGEQSFSQSRAKAHAGVDIPLIGPDLPVIGFMNNLSMSLNGDYEWIGQVGRLPGYNASLDWRPADFITIVLSRSQTRSAPILARTNDPVVYTPGVLVADVISGEYALVTRISGGTPDLRATSERESAASIALNKAWGSTNGSASVEYSSVRTANPAILTVYPSSLFQSLFPARFERDASGRLTAIDTRPFNALSEQREVVRSNLHLSGHAADSGAGASIPARGSLDWDLSVTHEWTLRDRLTPSTGDASIDLLKTPLDAVQGTPRHKFNIEAGGTYRQMTLQIGARWRSGVDVKDISATEGRAIRYAPFWTADAEFSWTLRRNRQGSDAARTLRLWLSVENILNKRLSVKDSTGKTPVAFQPAFLDPIGRVIAIRISHTL